MASTGVAVRAGDHTAVNGRFHQLDSLRGVAAATVVIHHAAIILPPALAATLAGGSQEDLMRWFYNTPLVAAWSGGNAVRLFFVLSGFVLALPFYGDRPPRFGAFMLRRWIRLWPPYMAAIAFALLIRYAVGGIRVDGLSAWFHDAWHDPLTLEQLMTHASMVLMANSAQTTPVLWSLTIELRVALIFPVLVWAVRRRGWWTLVASLGLAAVAGHDYPTLHDVEGVRMTAMCLPPFVFGILLARHRRMVVKIIGCHVKGGWRLAVALSAALALYTAPMTFLVGLGPLHFLGLTTSTLGSCAFLALAIASPTFADVLCRRPLLFLGRISYSLYLVHAVVLLGLVHASAGRDLWLVLPVGVMLSILPAWAICRWVEEPAIRWARVAPTLVANLSLGHLRTSSNDVATPPPVACRRDGHASAQLTTGLAPGGSETVQR